jgi:uncharacterized protein (DUF362 family)
MEKTSVHKCLVALQGCDSYDRDILKGKVDELCRTAGLVVGPGMTILIKPNLVSASGGAGQPGCSSPEFVAAAAEWCLDQGARVRVGDSPAFGSAKMVMRACGIDKALRHLDLQMVNFSRTRPVMMPCGIRVPVATEALDCDLLLNLPRVKAHGQLYVSLAVKNYFGVVAGFRKALHHAVNGDIGNRFESLLVELPALFPGSFSLLEGIVAMHRSGPMDGEAFPLGLVGASFDPFGLDTAVLTVLGADPRLSQIWLEAFSRGMSGSRLADLQFPLKNPEELRVEGFILPERLKPVTFHPARMLVGACRRMVAGFSKE